MAGLVLVRNADNTITVKAGDYREYISMDKSPVELLDAVRWAAITGGVVVDEGFLWERIMELRNA